MKFKIRRSNAKRRLMPIGAKRKKLRLMGINTLRIKKFKELSINYSAESFGAFNENENASRAHVFAKKIKASLEHLKTLWAKASAKMKEQSSIPCATLCGVLCSAIFVCFLSAAVVVSSLFLRYNGPHTNVNVPDLVSLDVNEAVNVKKDVFEYVIVYKSNPDKPTGVVTAQTPLPDVTRKFYGRRCISQSWTWDWFLTNKFA